jgi:glycosyltransferase involved in cell wall biosynthesis
MVKIVHVLNSFLPNQIAGTEIYVHTLCKELYLYSFLSKILIPNYKKSFPTDYQFDNLDVHQYAEPSIIDRSLIMGFRKPDGLKSFIEYLNIQKPEIVHFHEIAGSNGITLHHVEEAKKGGAKVLFTFHLAGLSCMTGTLYQNGECLCNGKIEIKKCTECYLQSKDLGKSSIKLLGVLSRSLYRLGLNPTKLSNTLSTALGTAHLVKKKQNDLNKLIAHCDKVVVLAKWYKDILISNGIADDKIVLIPQALPLNTHFAEQIKQRSNKIKFLFIGRISHFKGVHLLIDAFLKLERSRAELHIYGQSDGTDYEHGLREKTQTIDSIYWHGVLDNKNVVSTMSEYNALCLCSTITEMSPLVIQEAFAAKLPVIASNVNGNAELIKHGVNGLLFNFNDLEDLVKQIKRCLDESDLLPSLANNIMPPRSFSDVGQDYFELYKDLLG